MDIHEALRCPLARSFYEVLKALWTDELLLEQTFNAEPSSPFLRSCIAMLDHSRDLMKIEMLQAHPYSQTIKLQKNEFLSSDDAFSYIFRNCNPENFLMVRHVTRGVCKHCKKISHLGVFNHDASSKSLFYPTFNSLALSNQGFVEDANAAFSKVGRHFDPFQHFEIMVTNMLRSAFFVNDDTCINNYKDTCVCANPAVLIDRYIVLCSDPLFLLLDVPLQFQKLVSFDLKGVETWVIPFVFVDAKKQFRLIAVLHGDGTHFVATRLVDTTWYLFDGMKTGGVGVKNDGPFTSKYLTLKLLYSIE